MRSSNLDEYLETYGPLLAQQAQERFDPLHVPGRDLLPPMDHLLRPPYPAQQHAIAALTAALHRQKSVILCAEIGTGKTLMGAAAVAALAGTVAGVNRNAGGKPYRALVFCPGQLVGKWEREIRETLPDVHVFHINSFRDLTSCKRHSKPGAAVWYIVSRDRAKLGPGWKPAVWDVPGVAGLKCSDCLQTIVDKNGIPVELGALARRRQFCQAEIPGLDKLDCFATKRVCGAPLWQWIRKPNRWPPAAYIHKHLRGYFDYLIVDEIHEEKGAATLQAGAVGALAASVRKVIALTGTIVAGKAEDIRTILWRLAPKTLVAEGFGWKEQTAFNECYGRIERRVSTTTETAGEDARHGRGKTRSNEYKTVRPGIMPTLFGRHLIGNTIFLALDEVADNLPYLSECEEEGTGPVAVAMDGEQAAAYQVVEDELRAVVKDMVRKGDRRLLGAMLIALLSYPDYPFDWNEIGYWDRNPGTGEPLFWHGVVTPASLDPLVVRPKEQALVDMVKRERAGGRQCWVYVQYTRKRDVAGRLVEMMKREGLRARVLRASVTPAKREAWIAKHAPKLDVIVSHPKLVETGLDLFDKGGSYNFPTLLFYETGYNLNTLRQASRRAWRLAQWKGCKVCYLYYTNTMQEQAIALMGQKLTAARALEGHFSSEGLAAMAGEENMEMALAKALTERIPYSAQRSWAKIGRPVAAPADALDDWMEVLYGSVEILVPEPAGLESSDDWMELLYGNLVSA